MTPRTRSALADLRSLADAADFMAWAVRRGVGRWGGGGMILSGQFLCECGKRHGLDLVNGYGGKDARCTCDRPLYPQAVNAAAKLAGVKP